MSHDLRQYYLQQMGIETWELRANRTHKKNMANLAADVSSCIRCPLHKTRTQTVFSSANMNASLMIIGDAPGFDDDQQGLPFVGKAGGLLNKMLNSIGLSAEHVCLANALKCRPPDDRTPTSEEFSQCCDYLAQQIVMVAPKLILAVGSLAGQFLLNSTSQFDDMRGNVHDYQGTPVLISYHPSHLLTYPTDKKNAYKDLLIVKQLLGAVDN